MFKKSMFDGESKELSNGRSFIFRAYSDVRPNPQPSPPKLAERVANNEDVISIWSRHAHAMRVKEMKKWSGMQVVTDAIKKKSSHPNIHQMSAGDILHFCESIEVHPAHLVPFDDNQKLSLPTVLLELLIDMAHSTKSGKTYNHNDVYLAKRAIAFECERILHHMADDRNVPKPDGKGFATFSQAFAHILDDAAAIEKIGKADVLKITNKFGINAGRSYPYVDRLRDMAIQQAEEGFEEFNKRLDIKHQVMQLQINIFTAIYRKDVAPEAESDLEATDFLGSVIMSLATKGIHLGTANEKEIGETIQELLNEMASPNRHYETAKNIFKEHFGLRLNEQSDQDEQYLRAPELPCLDQLSTVVRLILLADQSIDSTEHNHETYEAEYILAVGRINDAFKLIRSHYERNLLNNRILLNIHKIHIENYVLPQTSPR